MSTKLKNLRIERDEAVEKAETEGHKVKALQDKILDLEQEVEAMHMRNGELENQLRMVGVQVEQHKTAIQGHEEEAIKKSEKAAQLQEQMKETKKGVKSEEKQFVENVQVNATTTNNA